MIDSTARVAGCACIADAGRRRAKGHSARGTGPFGRWRTGAARCVQTGAGVAVSIILDRPGDGAHRGAPSPGLSGERLLSGGGSVPLGRRERAPVDPRPDRHLPVLVHPVPPTRAEQALEQPRGAMAVERLLDARGAADRREVLAELQLGVEVEAERAVGEDVYIGSVRSLKSIAHPGLPLIHLPPG